MEQLKEKLDSSLRALKTLEEALHEPFSIVVRDASIQRFEYSFEAMWKLLKSYLQISEGIVCNSPKHCVREALKVGLLSSAEAKLTLEMTDDRNLTAHTYIEAVAEKIYGRLPVYLTMMKQLFASIELRSRE